TGRVACSSCHDPKSGGADPRGEDTSLGAAFTTRNTPAVVNAALLPWMFWDGRRDSLWSQALAPLESAAEHNTSRLQVAHRMFDAHRADYEAVFGLLPALDDDDRFPATGKPGDASYDTMSSDDRAAVD